MDKLYKPVQPGPNSFNYSRQNQGIFDIQTYQKAIDRISCSSSLEQMTHSKGKRFSLCETVNKYTNYPLFQGNQLRLKQEIRPHQAKQIVSRITEIIKTKKEASKFLSEQRNTQRIHQNFTTDKKVSYSAYINARKKIFDKQNLMNHSASAHSQSQQQSNKQLILEDDTKNTDIFGSDYLNQQLKNEFVSHSNNLTTYMNNTMNKYQRIRLQGIVTKKKIQVKKPKQTEKLSQNEIDLVKTRNLNRSFITVIKKRSNQSNLMINNTRVTSQRKIEEHIQPIDTYVKNFAKHTKLQQQDIQIYPQDILPIKLSKPAENQIAVEEVNSKSATILHYIDGQVKNILSLNEKEKLEIASITKSMTCFLVLTIADRFCIDLHKQKLIVSERASRMQGTSAKLAYSDVLSIYDALHALMLPSGNDAAIALGEWGGKQIRKYSSLLRRMKISKDEENEKSSNFINSFTVKRKSHLKLFIHHMNKLAKHLGLTCTHFVNTHGLMNQKAYSCSQNISLLTYHAMRNTNFRDIVAKKNYRCKIFNRTFSHSKEVTWENTNKLLCIQGFLGVKTGITPSAGPCLTSYFQISKDEYFIVTILKTKSCEMRFKETINLLKATLLHLLTKNPSNYAYMNAVTNLESYNRQDLKQEEKQFLNSCRESTESNEQQQQVEVVLLN